MIGILLADGEFWTWLTKLTEKAFDPLFLTALGTLATVLFKLVRDWNVPKELRKNSEDTKQAAETVKTALPQMVDKVDSATETLKAATDKTEKMIDTAAIKVGMVIGEKVGKDAKEAAIVVAQEAVKDRNEMSEKVNRIANAIHGSGDVDGESGICVVAKVTEQGKAIDKLDDRLTRVEVAVHEGFNKILSELKIKSDLDEVKAKEERHAKRGVEQIAQVKEWYESLAAKIHNLETVLPTSSKTKTEAK